MHDAGGFYATVFLLSNHRHSCEKNESLLLEPDHSELCLCDLSFHSNQSNSVVDSWSSLLSFLSGSAADTYLSNGAFEEPLAAFRIWGMMQVIDFFFFFLSLLLFESLLLYLSLLACACTDSSIASRCDQNIKVDWQVNKQRFWSETLSPSGPTGEELENVSKRRTSSSRGFPTLRRSPVASPPFFSTKLLSCSWMSAQCCQRTLSSPPSPIHPPFFFPASLRLALPPSLLISLP